MVWSIIISQTSHESDQTLAANYQSPGIGDGEQGNVAVDATLCEYSGYWPKRLLSQQKLNSRNS